MASATQVMLGKIIDTALAAPDRPFERRPRFIDDAAASDYMYRLGKKGKRAMDAELYDATYGDTTQALGGFMRTPDDEEEQDFEDEDEEEDDFDESEGD